MISRIDLKRSSRKNLIRLARWLRADLPAQFTTKELIDIVYQALKTDAWLHRHGVRKGGWFS